MLLEGLFPALATVPGIHSSQIDDAQLSLSLCCGPIESETGLSAKKHSSPGVLGKPQVSFKLFTAQL